MCQSQLENEDDNSEVVGYQKISEDRSVTHNHHIRGPCSPPWAWVRKSEDLFWGLDL